MDKQETKTCKGCLKLLSVSNFYRAGLQFQSRCRICYNKQGYKNKKNRRLTKPKIKGKGSWQKNAFSLLDKDIRDSMNRDLLSDLTLKEIAVKHRIKITTFYGWHNRGYMATQRVNGRRRS